MRKPIITKFVCTLFLLCFCAFVFAHGIKHPHKNWDIIGYVASIISIDSSSAEEISKRTYSEIKSEFNGEHFADAIRGGYREVVYNNPRALYEQIPFYKIRVGYIYSTKLIGNVFDIPYSTATYVVSSIFAVTSIVCLIGFCYKLKVNMYLVPFIALTAGILSVAKYSTPDSMALFFSLFGTLLILYNRNVGYIIFAMLPLIRTDFIIISVLFVFFAIREKKYLASFFTLFFSIFCYVFSNIYANNYGYFTILKFTMLGAVPFPSQISQDLPIKPLLLSAKVALYDFVQQKDFLVYWLSFAMYIGLAKSCKFSRDAIILFVIPFAFSVLHYLLFPIYMDRHYSYSTCMIILFLLFAFRTNSPCGANNSHQFTK